VSDPVTKISQVKVAAANGDWVRAIAIASKFHELGAHKAAIMGAREAYCRPTFQRQIGKDPEALIAAGIIALKDRYGV
jgi:hypothetical protein